MTLTLSLTVFLACAVEAVEAWTIVLAMGSRSWTAALSGALAGLAAVGILIGILAATGTAIPVAPLHVAVGLVLLFVGAQWLRKAVLRLSGRKALHDEQAIYGEALRKAGGAFALSFQGVLVEGIEIVVIVVGLGVGHMMPAAGAAVAAVIAVSGLAGAARAPLARVPENTMKLVVAVMLVSFGALWSAQGVAAVPELAVLVLIPLVACSAWLTSRRLAI